MSDRMSEIRARMAQEDVSAQERKTMMKEKFAMMSQPQEEVEYLAQGGQSGNPHLEGNNAVADKVNQAKAAGVSPDAISKILKNNAMMTRDAKVRGALLKGGLLTTGKAAAQQAGLIAQAGLNNNSFTPESALGGVAQGATEAASAEAKYQDELSRIEEMGQKNKKSATKNSPAKTYRQIHEALLLVDAASVAGDIVNGYFKLDAEQQAIVDAEEKSFGDKIKGGFNTTISTIAGGFSGTAKIRKEALAKIAIQSVPNSYQAFIRLERLATAIAQTVLSQQTGTKTDFDFEVAQKTIFNIAAVSNTWTPQLTDALNEMKAQAKDKAALDVIDAEYANKSPVVVEDVAVVSDPMETPTLDSGSKAGVSIGGVDKDTLLEQGQEVFGAVAENVQDTFTPDENTITVPEVGSFQLETVAKKDIPDNIVSLLKNATDKKTVGEWKDVVIYQDDETGIIYMLADAPGDKKIWRVWFTATRVGE